MVVDECDEAEAGRASIFIRTVAAEVEFLIENKQGFVAVSDPT